jgi:hypothetical protein
MAQHSHAMFEAADILKGGPETRFYRVLAHLFKIWPSG